MKVSRPYHQAQRAHARERTGERILEAAESLYRHGWYDEVTLRDVAREADVATQTVVNHFGSKAKLLAAVAERIGERFDPRRDEIAGGDADGAVAMIFDEYEEIGDSIVRMITLEGRVDELTALLSHGRKVHRAWVQRVFAAALPHASGIERDRRTAMFVAATDVLTWKILRREQGLSRRAAQAAMRETVEALLGQRTARR
ncbi:MAG: TetR/AcrR family transcriptional regulator [Thermoleophilia bacterium]|nr:TetR/AcrR family transcriptional regulator [Thermoleophilia bacterium]